MYYQNLLDSFTKMCREILKSSLTGIYLHGSLAMGCFHPDKSDIDIIVVIEENITDEQKLSFMKNVVKLNEKAPAKGLEVSIVIRNFCKPFVYPTPYELHFSPAHLSGFIENPDAYIKNMNGRDKDLAAHFTIIKRYGIVLCGEAVAQVFGEVSKEDYLDSLWHDIQNAKKEIAEDPLYVILNVCRVSAFIRDGLCLSKEKGGKWGLDHLSEVYRPLIADALECYGSDRIMRPDVRLATQFADEMLTEIRRKTDSYQLFTACSAKETTSFTSSLLPSSSTANPSKLPNI